jgi:hypothetical protein
MSLPTDKRQTAEQAADFAKKALEQNELQPMAFASHRKVRAGSWSSDRWRTAVSNDTGHH